MVSCFKVYIRAQGSGFRVVRIFQVSKISAIHGWHGTVWLEFLVWRKSGNREVERGEGLQIRCEVHHLEFKASGAQETALVLGFKLQDMPSDLKKHTNYEQQASIPNRKHQLRSPIYQTSKIYNSTTFRVSVFRFRVMHGWV